MVGGDPETVLAVAVAVAAAVAAAAEDDVRAVEARGLAR